VILSVGAGIGFAAGLAADQALASIVYHASSRDPIVVLGVVLTMVAAGLAATWVPAHRALLVDPASTLREG
jgi:ABC-type lipoprotein release transport system permease subunit